MAYSYYYGGFVFFGIALLALLIRFCCQVYNKHSYSARRCAPPRNARSTTQQAYRSQAVRQNAPQSPRRTNIQVLVVGVPAPRSSFAPPTYDESLAQNRATSPPPPPASLHVLAGETVPTPDYVESGPPPPHPAAGGDESPMGVPPAYSSLGFEDSGDQDANDCSDNQPLISTEIV